MICRDSLRSDLERKSKHGTTFERTSIEDRRRKLEDRLNQFNRKAEEFMGEDAEEDLDVLPQFTGWEKGDKKDGEDEDQLSDQEEDEEENLEKPETTPICMPSSLKPDDIKRLGLEVLAAQELELQKGQVTDCLQSLRLALGHKAILYRTKVRVSKSSVDRTRAWDDIKASKIKVNKHVRAYKRARRALKHLGADNTILSKYQELQTKDLRLSADITEENRVGQRNDTLPWFWRMEGQNAEQHDAWMEECMFVFAHTHFY